MSYVILSILSYIVILLSKEADDFTLLEQRVLVRAEKNLGFKKLFKFLFFKVFFCFLGGWKVFFVFFLFSVQWTPRIKLRLWKKHSIHLVRHIITLFSTNYINKRHILNLTTRLWYSSIEQFKSTKRDSILLPQHTKRASLQHLCFTR